MIEDYTKQIIEMYESNDLKNNYPESYQAICGAVSEIDSDRIRVTTDFFDLACNLHGTDGAKDMHPLVAQFCLQVYFEEYVKGNADAALNLGSLYYSGRAGEQNYAKAVEYYTFAADRGSLIASENLGYCYYYGRDVEKNYEKAFKYFLKGALAGHIISLYKIGDFYKNGFYVDKDEKEAFRIYNLCGRILNDDTAKLAGADVFMRLAQCFYKGIGVEPDLEEALRLYQLSESMYYTRLKNGNFMIKKNLDRVIAEEEEVRQLIRSSMPEKK